MKFPIAFLIGVALTGSFGWNVALGTLALVWGLLYLVAGIVSFIPKGKLAGDL